MERFSFIFLVAGLGFFALAFLLAAWLPMIAVLDLDIRTVEQLAETPPPEAQPWSSAQLNSQAPPKATPLKFSAAELRSSAEGGALYGNFRADSFVSSV